MCAGFRYLREMVSDVSGEMNKIVSQQHRRPALPASRCHDQLNRMLLQVVGDSTRRKVIENERQGSKMEYGPFHSSTSTYPSPINTTPSTLAQDLRYPKKSIQRMTTSRVLLAQRERNPQKERRHHPMVSLFPPPWLSLTPGQPTLQERKTLHAARYAPCN